MSHEYRQRQAALIAERAAVADIVITTALVPGRPAPVLLSEDTVKAMKPGSVIVDLAVEQGGNCALAERDRVVVAHGVRMVGYSNLPALLAADASALYARNLLNFLKLLVDPATGALESIETTRSSPPRSSASTARQPANVRRHRMTGAVDPTSSTSPSSSWPSSSATTWSGTSRPRCTRRS